MIWVCFPSYIIFSLSSFLNALHYLKSTATYFPIQRNIYCRVPRSKITCFLNHFQQVPWHFDIQILMSRELSMHTLIQLGLRRWIGRDTETGAGVILSSWCTVTWFPVVHPPTQCSFSKLLFNFSHINKCLSLTPLGQPGRPLWEQTLLATLGMEWPRPPQQESQCWRMRA